MRSNRACPGVFASIALGGDDRVSAFMAYTHVMGDGSMLHVRDPRSGHHGQHRCGRDLSPSMLHEALNASLVQFRWVPDGVDYFTVALSTGLSGPLVRTRADVGGNVTSVLRRPRHRSLRHGLRGGARAAHLERVRVVRQAFTRDRQPLRASLLTRRLRELQRRTTRFSPLELLRTMGGGRIVELTPRVAWPLADALMAGSRDRLALLRVAAGLSGPVAPPPQLSAGACAAMVLLRPATVVAHGSTIEILTARPELPPGPLVVEAAGGVAQYRP